MTAAEECDAMLWMNAFGPTCVALCRVDGDGAMWNWLSPHLWPRRATSAAAEHFRSVTHS